MKDHQVSSGERLETSIFNQNTYEHLHRYALTFDFIKDKVVLDIASGEGYGSKLMSSHALKVIGVDIDKETIESSKLKYVSSNLEFRLGSADSLPLENESVDVVVSFETIEHHDLHEEMLKEIKRVLRKNGILIISTPDKRYYSDETNYSNRFHVKELYKEEFENLLKSNFQHVSMLYQNYFVGSIIASEYSFGIASYEGGYDEIKKSPEKKSVYLIGIASDHIIDAPLSSTFRSIEIEKKMIEKIVKDTFDVVIDSWRYRIGSLILWPVALLQKLVRKI